jgi:hypothetical protein
VLLAKAVASQASFTSMRLPESLYVASTEAMVVHWVSLGLLHVAGQTGTIQATAGRVLSGIIVPLMLAVPHFLLQSQ